MHLYLIRGKEGVYHSLVWGGAVIILIYFFYEFVLVGNNSSHVFMSGHQEVLIEAH